MYGGGYDRRGMKRSRSPSEWGGRSYNAPPYSQQWQGPNNHQPPSEAEPQVKKEPSPPATDKSDTTTPAPAVKEEKPDIKNLESKSENKVQLDQYNSDLHLIIEKNNPYASHPLYDKGFAYVWSGVRASHGVKTGKIVYEVRLVEHLDVSHLPPEEATPHVLRVGFSTDDTSMQLGEEPDSWGYGGTGKISTNCQFKNYGIPFMQGDCVACFLNMEADPVEVSFAVNGKAQGVAYYIPKKQLGSKALYPHILSKNTAFEVNFGQLPQPYYPLPNGYESYIFIDYLPDEQKIPGASPPKSNEKEILMMCGLPGCGKTTWVAEYCSKNPEKKYNVIGTNALIDKMKVMGLARKRNYHGRWDVLIKHSSDCLNHLMKMAGGVDRNFILDQTNVYPSAQKRKMKMFEGFKKKAIVIVPTDEEYKKRCDKRDREEGKEIPDSAVLEMKANFVLPEDGTVFDEVIFTELRRDDAEPLVRQYNEEGRGATGPPGAKRFRQDESFRGGRGRGGFRGGRGGFDGNAAAPWMESGRGGPPEPYDGNRGGWRGGYRGGRGGGYGDRPEGYGPQGFGGRDGPPPNYGGRDDNFGGRPSGFGGPGGREGRGFSGRGGFGGGDGGFRGRDGGGYGGRGGGYSGRDSGFSGREGGFGGRDGGYGGRGEGSYGGRGEGGYGGREGGYGGRDGGYRGGRDGGFRGGRDGGFGGGNRDGSSYRGSGRGGYGGRDPNYGERNSGFGEGDGGYGGRDGGARSGPGGRDGPEGRDSGPGGYGRDSDYGSQDMGRGDSYNSRPAEYDRGEKGRDNKPTDQPPDYSKRDEEQRGNSEYDQGDKSKEYGRGRNDYGRGQDYRGRGSDYRGRGSDRRDYSQGRGGDGSRDYGNDYGRNQQQPQSDYSSTGSQYGSASQSYSGSTPASQPQSYGSKDSYNQPPPSQSYNAPPPTNPTAVGNTYGRDAAGYGQKDTYSSSTTYGATTTQNPQDYSRSTASAYSNTSGVSSNYSSSSRPSGDQSYGTKAATPDYSRTYQDYNPSTLQDYKNKPPPNFGKDTYPPSAQGSSTYQGGYGGTYTAPYGQQNYSTQAASTGYQTTSGSYSKYDNPPPPSATAERTNTSSNPASRYEAPPPMQGYSYSTSVPPPKYGSGDTKPASTDYYKTSSTPAPSTGYETKSDAYSTSSSVGQWGSYTAAPPPPPPPPPAANDKPAVGSTAQQTTTDTSMNPYGSYGAWQQSYYTGYATSQTPMWNTTQTTAATGGYTTGSAPTTTK